MLDVHVEFRRGRARDVDGGAQIPRYEACDDVIAQENPARPVPVPLNEEPVARAERAGGAVENGEKIVVHADEDVPQGGGRLRDHPPAVDGPEPRILEQVAEVTPVGGAVTEGVADVVLGGGGMAVRLNPGRPEIDQPVVVHHVAEVRRVDGDPEAQTVLTVGDAVVIDDVVRDDTVLTRVELDPVALSASDRAPLKDQVPGDRVAPIARRARGGPRDDAVAD